MKEQHPVDAHQSPEGDISDSRVHVATEERPKEETCEKDIDVPMDWR